MSRRSIVFWDATSFLRWWVLPALLPVLDPKMGFGQGCRVAISLEKLRSKDGEVREGMERPQRGLMWL